MPIEFILFYTSPALCQQVAHVGISTYMVDFESKGKNARQTGHDTQINTHTLADLAHLRETCGGYIVCRTNAWEMHPMDEILGALDCGADEIMLPMVRSPREIEAALALINGRAHISMMLETQDAVNRSREFAALPLRRAYIGLNDLHIERGSPNLFYPIIDGTLDQVAAGLGNIPFGFAGLTLPGHGFPLPCNLLIQEMARRGADFGVLRRSFLRDIQGRDPSIEVPRMREAFSAAQLRSPEQQQADHEALRRAIMALPDGKWPTA